VGTLEFQRPGLVAADPAGKIAVLELKAGTVSILESDGSPLALLDWKEAGLRQPLGLAFGNDGSLHIVDRSGGRWVRFR
jgi:hypothetical protein